MLFSFKSKRNLGGKKPIKLKVILLGIPTKIYIPHPSVEMCMALHLKAEQFPMMHFYTCLLQIKGSWHYFVPGIFLRSFLCYFQRASIEILKTEYKFAMTKGQQNLRQSFSYSFRAVDSLIPRCLLFKTQFP